MGFLYSARPHNCNLRVGCTTRRASALNHLDDVKALNNLTLWQQLEASSSQNIYPIFTENDMLVIEPTSGHRGDDELGPVGVGASIGHGQKVSLVVVSIKVLV
jgi:hypothetical protein